MLTPHSFYAVIIGSLSTFKLQQMKLKNTLSRTSDHPLNTPRNTNYP
jgi:hypothetical protein